MNDQSAHKLNYEIEINARVDRVWDTLVRTETYRRWVKAFSPNSYYEGDWVQGTEIKFLDPDMGGTKALLEIVDPRRRLFARHIAVVSKDGEESTSGDMADKWIGTTEDYCLGEVNGMTSLAIEIITHEDFVGMFNDAWPKALASIKQLSEE